MLAGGVPCDEGGGRRQDHQRRFDDVDLWRQFAPAYAASKGGIVQFTRSCAVAWAADNIQANAILPGWIDTDLTKRAREQIDGLHDKVLTRTPAARWGGIADFAGIAVYLASHASDFVTGTAIPVDGGFSIMG
jgi:2-deoxy-D-gluconate 3-dehydrogenase